MGAPAIAATAPASRADPVGRAPGAAEATGWEAQAAHFYELFSPTAFIADKALGAIAGLTRQAGLGATAWGAPLQQTLETPGLNRAFREGFDQGVIEGAEGLVTGVATLVGKTAQYGGDHLAGGAGDGLRGWAHAHLPQGVQDYLKTSSVGAAIKAITPSGARGAANDQALAAMGEGIGRYFRTHSAGEVGGDVKAVITRAWGSLAASHAQAAQAGPAAEARWWGKVLGRAAFEVAATFVPVAGVAGKAGESARIGEAAGGLVRGLEADGVIARGAGETANGAAHAFAAGVEATARRLHLSPETVQRILDTPKPDRPAPASYLAPATIERHLAQFRDGAVRIQASAPAGKIGRTETWVMPKAFVDRAIRDSHGDPRQLEQLLGLDRGVLGDHPVRVDIPHAQNPRLPSGNEFGANTQWRPGGFTWPGGIPEAVIDPVPAGAYTVKSVY